MNDPAACGCETVETAETWTWVGGLLALTAVMLLLAIWNGGA